MYQPSQLQQFLQNLGVAAKKGLSQNFLIDGNIIRKIVHFSEVAKDDLVLEIGPGPGALTQALLAAGATVLAVEKDNGLAQALPRILQPGQHLEVFHEDILKFPIQKTIQDRLECKKKAKIIANLPYHLTTPILAAVVPLYQQVLSLTFMVQKEVAERMRASPGQRDYSALTLFVQFYSEVRYGFTVSRNCFYPRPKVDSAVVQLILRPPLQVADETAFFTMTRTAFCHRRKMLRASLKDLYDPTRVIEALQRIGCSQKARPEELSLDQFQSLFALLYGHTTPCA